MKIPDRIRKTVAFIAYENKLDQTVRPVGSVFFVGPVAQGALSASRVFAVTARHVIVGLKKKGCENCVLRLNPVNSEDDIVSITVPIKDWKFHPNDESLDVAVYEKGLPPEFDHLVIPLSHGATAENLKNNNVTPGDEVFISGLFIHHHGARRNIPIIRTGNLAALDDEPVLTGDSKIQAYLIEARSIGGLSGSPVFLNLGASPANGAAFEESRFLLLGLIHGHYDVRTEEAGKDTISASINSGIAIVVPFTVISEVIEHAMRQNST